MTAQFGPSSENFIVPLQLAIDNIHKVGGYTKTIYQESDIHLWYDDKYTVSNSLGKMLEGKQSQKGETTGAGEFKKSDHTLSSVLKDNSKVSCYVYNVCEYYDSPFIAAKNRMYQPQELELSTVTNKQNAQNVKFRSIKR